MLCVVCYVLCSWISIVLVILVSQIDVSEIQIYTFSIQTNSFHMLNLVKAKSCYNFIKRYFYKIATITTYSKLLQEQKKRSLIKEILSKGKFQYICNKEKTTFIASINICKIYVMPWYSYSNGNLF